MGIPAMIDGKDHPLTGSADGDTIALRRISANSIETTYKLKGKVTLVNVRTVSADGKTMTVTTERDSSETLTTKLTKNTKPELAP